MAFMDNEYINKILCGDAKDVLIDMPDKSVDLVITSPPYYNQRDYGSGGIGNEDTTEEYVNNLVVIFDECVRVLKDTGSIVFNIGDKYQNGNLMLIPYRFALEAMKINGVKLINEITWVKSNPAPKQDKKKLIPATEPFFVFVKSNNYYFNKDDFLDHLDLLRKKKIGGNGNIGGKYFQLIEQSNLTKEQKIQASLELQKAIIDVKNGKIASFRMKIKGIHALPYGGQPGGRMMHIEKDGFTIIRISGKSLKRDVIESPVETIKGNIHPAIYPEFVIYELIKLLTKENDVVLDPFIGSGTTALVAKKINRNYIGIEISPKYAEYAQDRIEEIAVRNEKKVVELFV